MPMRWRTAAAATLTLLAALALAGTACTNETRVTLATPEQTGIAVSGTGRVTVVPDIGVLNLGVQVTRPTVAAARDAAAKAMEAVRASLKQNGVDDRDIATQGFSIQPQYDFRPTSGAPRITGYLVSNQVTVKVRAMDALSRVLDGAVAAGGDDVRVNGVAFSVDKPEQYRDKAREQAVADARARAETLAKAAGVKLGKARSVSEGGGPEGIPVPVRAAASGVGGVAVDTPVSPGQTDITLTVNVVFDIE